MQHLNLLHVSWKRKWHCQRWVLGKVTQLKAVLGKFHMTEGDAGKFHPTGGSAGKFHPTEGSAPYIGCAVAL